MDALNTVHHDDFDTAIFIAQEVLDDNIAIRAEYEARLYAAHRLIAEQTEHAAKFFAALVAVVSHVDRLPVDVAEQVREAVASVGGRHG